MFACPIQSWTRSTPNPLLNKCVAQQCFNTWKCRSVSGMPAYDMVVAHKVDLDRVREEKYVTTQEFRTILDMLFSSYCGKACQAPR